MPRSQQAVFSFTGGVRSPRLTVRADMEDYQSSMQYARNWIVSPHGGIYFRPGMKHIGSPQTDAPFRLFQFHRGGDISDILLEVTAGAIRYWVEDSVTENLILLLVDESGNVLVDEADAQLAVGEITSVNSYLQEDLSGLEFTNRDNLAIITHKNHPPLYIRIDFDGTITADPLPFDRVPRFNYKDTKSPSGVNQSVTYEVSFPATWTSSGRSYQPRFAGYNRPEGVLSYQFQDPDSGAAVNNAQDIETELTALIADVFSAGNPVPLVTETAPGGGPTPVTYTVSFNGPNAGLEFSIDNRSGDGELITMVEVTSTTTNSEPAWSYPFVVTNGGTPNYYQCIQAHFSDSLAQDENEPGVGANWENFWTDLGTTKPTWFDYQWPDGSAWAVDTTYSPWERGWPELSVFHQQRLILAASTDAPTTIFGSQISEYNFFQTGANADQPFIFVLDSSDTPKIKWMRSQLNLMVGTSSGDWNLSADVSIGPADISAVKQNNARSNKSPAVSIDTEIFYIEQGQTKLRATRYVRDYNGFSSTDTSLPAEQLLRDGVFRIVAQYVPEVMMTMVGTPDGTSDNTAPMMTYEKNQGIAAWTDGIVTDGQMVDVAGYFSLPTNADHLYFAVLRNGSYYIEKMIYPPREYFDMPTLTEQDLVWMDSYSRGQLADTNLITGLDRLEGMQVGVLLNDAWEGFYTVTGGTVTLPENHTGWYAVGLVYEGDMLTYENAQGNPSGVAFGTARRWNKLYVRMLDSALPIINGQLPPDRTPETPMNIAETLQPGLTNNKVANVGYGDGSIRIQQDRPYPTHILGCYGEFGSNNS